jgi:hypothetical protein
MIKFNSLLANCVIFHTALDMTDVLRQLLAEGWQPEQGKDITAADIAQLSPYLTAHISRFGLYATDVLRLRPDAFDPRPTPDRLHRLGQGCLGRLCSWGASGPKTWPYTRADVADGLGLFHEFMQQP